ncbi:MAG: CTP synthase, partial [Clostridia bacterium]|nr:CTP synthase [Clostridia bacterium]
NEIKKFIYSVGEKSNADVVITEIGGTTGDIESQPFLEAIRQVSVDVGKENCVFIHVTLIPYISSSGEYKSKPTQHSVKELRSLGINPDIIVARCDKPLTQSIKDKISLFCNVKPDCVINNITVSSLYHAPAMLEESNFSDIVCRELHLDSEKGDMAAWNDMLTRIDNRTKKAKIALVGKYVQLHDAYLSVVEALNHGGFETDTNIEIKWIDSELITKFTVNDHLGDCDGILVPGGFGGRGLEGKLEAAKYAREHNIPYLGICLGMQAAVIEFARDVLGFDDANSEEFEENTEHPVIHLMNDQKDKTEKGGTMRLGAYPCHIKEGSVMSKAYGEDEVAERHRHRYEFNNEYRAEMEGHGMKITGVSPNGVLVEAVEIPSHKFFVGVQYHPEFKSRPNRAHPLFREFVRAASHK